MAVVSTYVYVHTSKDGSVLLAPGDKVPAGARVSNAAALAEEPQAKADEKADVKADAKAEPKAAASK